MLLGRDAEFAALDRIVRDSATGSFVVTIVAPPGAGKTTVLTSVAAAVDPGTRVLRAVPTAAESGLAYAGLGDLFGGLDDLDTHLEHLGEVHRGAFDSAMLRVPAPAGVPVDARTVGGAVATVLARLAADQQVLVVIDDLHWLDEESGSALAFALRRLPPHGVTVIATRRPDEPGPTLPGDTFPLGPLSDEVVRRLLLATFDDRSAALSGARLAAIVEAAAGNPLFALELARTTVAAAPGALDEPLEVPADLVSLVAGRLDDLDADVADALAAVALLERPDVARARRLGLTDAIGQAERIGVVSTGTGRITFGHPLFAAAVLARTPASVRRRLHARLAAELDDPFESIRHLALAAEDTDADLAARLDEAVGSLTQRGALSQAADLAVSAARLSPPDHPRRNARYVEAALLSFRRGDPAAAEAMLASVDPATMPADVRRRELMARAHIAYSSGVGSHARSWAEQALAWCERDAERVEVHTLVARCIDDDFRLAAHHAEQAMSFAGACERGSLTSDHRAAAMLAHAETMYMTGRGLDHELFRAAIELEREHRPFVTDSAEAAYATLLKQTDELDTARALLLELLERAADDGAVPFVLSHLPQLELWAGNWDLAEDYAQRHLEAALRTGQTDQAAQAGSSLSLISLMRGDVADARDTAVRLLATAEANGDRWTERSATGLLGQCFLAEGDAVSAAAMLDRTQRLSDEMGIGDPGYCRLQPDHVEALVASGRIDDADALSRRMHETAVRLDRSTSIAAAARSRALVHAARGDRGQAVAAAREAVDRYASSPLVIDHARALLTLGQVHRRFKEKAAARDALQAALEVFERLGAERFARRARQDLARIGLRPPSGSGLTETERRVAELAGTGKTVRQVADELFVSPKTVEANLTRVYRKLGIGGRAELATWLAASR